MTSWDRVGVAVGEGVAVSTGGGVDVASGLGVGVNVGVPVGVGVGVGETSRTVLAAAVGVGIAWTVASTPAAIVAGISPCSAGGMTGGAVEVKAGKAVCTAASTVAWMSGEGVA